MLTIGSLFSGLGGLELGLEWAGLGPVVWQVERDPKCRAVLAHHWPEVPRYEEVRAVGAVELGVRRADLICGGFPCQDVSAAGRRAGLAGDRSGLWYEFARIVAACRPQWVVVENVRSGANAYVDAVRRELAKLAYASFPIPLAASDVGAPHARARVFIVARRFATAADGDHEGELASAQDAGRAALELARAPVANANGEPVRLERLESRSPGGHRGPQAPEPARHAADADGEGELGKRRSVAHEGAQQGRRWPANRGAARLGRHAGWAVEPDVPRMVHGSTARLDRTSGRLDRERMLGNCVVPQDAEVVGHVIRQIEGW